MLHSFLEEKQKYLESKRHTSGAFAHSYCLKSNRVRSAVMDFQELVIRKLRFSYNSAPPYALDIDFGADSNDCIRLEVRSKRAVAVQAQLSA